MSTRIRPLGQAALDATTTLILALREAGADSSADEVTRAHDALAKAVRRAVSEHRPRIVGGIGIGPARPRLELVGGKAKKR